MESPEPNESYYYEDPIENSGEPEYANVMYTNPNSRPQPRQVRPPFPRGPRFRCQGDHLIRDCPLPSPTPPEPVTIQGFCQDCGKEHLLRDCPKNPNNMPKITPINVIGLVVDSTGSITSTAPVHVVTRAQSLQQTQGVGQEKSSEVSETESITKKRTRAWRDSRERMKRQWSQKMSELEESLRETKAKISELASQNHSHTTPPPPFPLPANPSSSIPQPFNTPPLTHPPPRVGSVLADATPEDLDMMLKAYQARIQEGPNVTDHEKCYPRVDLEIERTKFCAKMVELTQAMFEASRLFNGSNPIKTPLHFDGLLDRLERLLAKSGKGATSEAKERESDRISIPPQRAYVPDSTEPDTSSSMNRYSPEFMREIEEEKWAKESEVPPPIELVDDAHDQFPQDIPSIYEEQESAHSHERLDFESNSLQELPHFTGPWETKSTCLRAPIVMIRNEDSIIRRNTEVVKNTKVHCNLTLEELLKVKPEVWKHVAKQVPDIAKSRSQVGSHRTVPEIPLGKIGDMSEGEEGNTYLPVTHQGYTTKAILDSGA
ncbi:hypothetical protein KP509_18G005900 [Ceratopteris richardii]|uniref:Uncharacterized protein n=1 Tax=Ceratopteris richardii TaxID=49495 RepID=A0A8T2SPA9_CERRI|nr:hypothetical protein KP509_18G005900 [Ceratopteris richardii]